MTAPDLTLRVVMITTNVADDIEDGLELSAEPTVILQGGIDAIKSAAKMFGEQVTITRAAPSLSAALALPEVAALVEALNTIDAMDPEGQINGFGEYAMRGLILRMGETARAALAALKGRAND